MAAITAGEYSRKPESYWRGKKVRALRPLQTGQGRVPAGTICTITKKFSGFSVETEACPHCGAQWFASKANYTAFELVGAE